MAVRHAKRSFERRLAINLFAERAPAIVQEMLEFMKIIGFSSTELRRRPDVTFKDLIGNEEMQLLFAVLEERESYFIDPAILPAHYVGQGFGVPRDLLEALSRVVVYGIECCVQDAWKKQIRSRRDARRRNQ